MELKTVKISELKPHPLNPRIHPDEAIKRLTKSIEEYGWTNPILASRDGTVLAGHARLKAAERAGIKEVPVIYLDLEGDRAEAYMIADNRTAELTDWDFPKLKDLLESLDTGSMDMEITGFSLKEIEDLLTQYHVPEEGLTDDDEIPEKVETICKTGDLWQLGNHRLLCGDATKKEDVERLMGGEKAELMIADPPYGVGLDQSWRDKALGSKALGKGNIRKIISDDCSDWSVAYSLFSGSVAYVWHATLFTDIVKNGLEMAGFDVRQMIIWNKTIMVMGRAAYHWKHEPCWYAVRKGQDANWKGGRTQTTVWDAPSPNHIMAGSKDDKTEHPSQKPLAIMEPSVRNHTSIGDAVYDPFGGSGSTLIACEKLGRRCFMMEIDEHYCDVIIARWEAFVGKKAIRIEG